MDASDASARTLGLDRRWEGIDWNDVKARIKHLFQADPNRNIRRIGDSDDAAQATIQRLIADTGLHRREFGASNPPTALLRIVLRRAVLDLHRKHRPLGSLESGQAQATIETPSMTLRKEELLGLIRDRATPEGFELLWMRAAEQRSYPELARIFGVEEATVRRRFDRLIAKLRQDRTLRWLTDGQDSTELAEEAGAGD